MEFDRSFLEKDRLSNLPNELLHHILSCFDTKFAVQTCLLSSRWKLLWTSMPCLTFSTLHFPSLPKFARFVTHVLSRHHTLKLPPVKLIIHGAGSKSFMKMIQDYGLSCHLQELTVTRFPKNHLYISPSLKRHNFSTHFFAPIITTPTWDLPALTSLHLSEIKFTRDSLVLFSNCVNLKNITLKSFDILDTHEFDIITPLLSNLTLIDGKCSNLVINLIAPKLENLTIIDCSVINNLLNMPPGLSSLCYKGCYHPWWLSKYRFYSLSKVIISLSACMPPYEEDDARKTIKMLQGLHTAKFLTLNSDIVECISSFPDLLSHLPSPFSKLILLNIVSDARKDAYNVNMSTQVENFFLDNSPKASFIMESTKVIPSPPTQVREDEMNTLVADIEGLMKEVVTPVKLKDTLKKRLKSMEKTEVALMAEWTKKNKKMAQVAQAETFLEEMKNVFNQCFEDVGVLFSKKDQIKSMLEKLPTNMESSYSRQFHEAEIQCFLLLFCILSSHSKVDRFELKLADLTIYKDCG